MPIRCEIVSQDRTVFEDDVDMVVLPGSEGEMGVLPQHTPLLTSLNLGVITVKKGQEEFYFTVSGGVAEIQPDIITVLADAAENVEEIDIERAQAARQRAEALLAEAKPEQDLSAYLAAEAALRRSNLRLGAVKRYRRKASTRRRHGLKNGSDEE